MKNFMQCCYTRVGGQSIGSGWQSVACSADVPLDVQKNYGTLQNANVPVNMPTDEKGNPLNLFDISVMGDHLYLTRVQYGLLDELNRKNNMFAHTFIFNGKDDEIFENPNIFLTVTDENFKASENEAANIPETLARREDFTLQRALELCGLDKKSYEKLLNCVYAQIYANKSKKPLYISGVENGEQMRGLLYCIYRGIPYSMRRMLTCATAHMNDSLKKNIIFSDRRGSSDLFLDLRTGEDNVLTTRILSRFSRYEFVDSFPKRWEVLDNLQYFEELDDMAVKLGNPQALDATILKIAYQMIKKPDTKERIESFSEDEIHEKIYEALNARSEKSPLMEQYIAQMLLRINRESWLLSDEEEEVLEYKLETSETKLLQQAGEQYNINRLSQMTPDKAAEKLKNMKESMFQNYSRKLVGFPGGKEIMDLYYSSYYLGEEVTWEKLDLLLKESSYVSGRYRTIDRVEEEAWKLYTAEIEKDENPREAFRNYLKIMEKADESGKGYEGYRRSAQEEYWEHVTIKNFDKRKEEEYRMFHILDNTKCDIIFKLQHLLRGVENERYTEALMLETAELVESRRNFFDDVNKEALLEKIDEAAERSGEKLSKIQKTWYEIVVYLMDVSMTKTVLRLNNEWKNPESHSEITYDRLQRDLLKSSRNLKGVSALINQIFIKRAEKWEGKDENRTVLLDFWLIMGKYEYDNPFEIIDHININMLMDEADIVSKESELLYQDEYQNFAEEYIKAGGENAKQVKVWMSVIKKQQKQKKKQKVEEESRDAGREESSVFNFWGKLTQKVVKGDTEESDDKKKKKGGFWKF